MKVNCVILRWAIVDNPAKNLKSYFRAEILRKLVKEELLRMTNKNFCSQILRTARADTSPLRDEALACGKQFCPFREKKIEK